ncbi:MAG: DUF4835 family protein, partial [Bacteroidaceae bacterium]|nr:DUF4835 family protein [Bacteroidaceae bacterium]
MCKISRFLLCLLGGFLCSFRVVDAVAQELNCTVKVIHSQVQGTNKSVFETLESAITEFMNNREWTDLQFQKSERIDCSMNITIKKYDEANNAFTGEL